MYEALDGWRDRCLLPERSPTGVGRPGFSCWVLLLDLLAWGHEKDLVRALAVLGPTLHYTEEWYGPSSAVLEFEAELDGLYVQGVDLLRWDDDNRLTSFTVMVRPMRGLAKLVELMQAQLTR